MKKKRNKAFRENSKPHVVVATDSLSNEIIGAAVYHDNSLTMLEPKDKTGESAQFSDSDPDKDVQDSRDTGLEDSEDD
ncbi:hypothetical protein [Pseudomonas sp. NPDC089401]|uniref:hypothetical protein n=1 Tax=Pseudomonas sp. NPDC089401 TaxID=3364462 RepID=UPI00382B54FB